MSKGGALRQPGGCVRTVSHLVVLLEGLEKGSPRGNRVLRPQVESLGGGLGFILYAYRNDSLGMPTRICTALHN